MSFFKTAIILSVLSLVSAAPEITIGNTTIIGRDISPLKQEFFGGIPYAFPPVGPLRLRPPVPRTSISTDTFDASDFGPGCLQPPGTQSIGPLSEDCLSINVLRPTGTPQNASLPVMAWIYGGGFYLGNADIYNGSAIVAQSMIRGTPIIYVNFNYRLGPLGFPQGEEAQSQGSLNLGLHDQITALQWIQDNIQYFGGDKSKVTVFGESAGAMCIAVHLLNPDFGRLARAAIMESGSAASPGVFQPSRGQPIWEKFVRGVPPCSSVANSSETFSCLQAANTTDVFQGVNSSLFFPTSAGPFSPVLDGPNGFLPDLPSSLIKQEAFARIPFIAGANLDEGTLFVSTAINSTDAVREWVLSNLTASSTPSPFLQLSIDTLLELYPDIPYLGSPINTGNETFGLSSQFKRLALIADDLIFHALRRQWIQAASEAGVKAFGYLFADPQPTLPPFLGVTHGSDLVYTYGEVNTSASAERLSINMIDYWVSFTTSLDPNDGLGTQRPQWTQYTPDNQVLLQLDGANTMLIPDDYRAQHISFINSQSLLYGH